MPLGYISTGMVDRFSALLMCLMAWRLMPVDRNPFHPCYIDCIYVDVDVDRVLCYHDSLSNWVSAAHQSKGTVIVTES